MVRPAGVSRRVTLETEDGGPIGPWNREEFTQYCSNAANIDQIFNYLSTIEERYRDLETNAAELQIANQEQGTIIISLREAHEKVVKELTTD